MTQSLAPLKRCSRCKTERPLAEFTRDKQAPDGLNRRCRDCKRKLSNEYAASHPEAVRENSRRHYAKSEKRRADQAAWRKANHDRVIEIKRAYRERHPDEGRVYYLANREQSLARTHRRRALLRAATVGAVDLGALWVANEGRCQLCGEPIDRTLRAPHPMSASVDHIVPLARGGTHEQTNLQWTHLVENISKGATVPFDRRKWSPSL